MHESLMISSEWTRVAGEIFVAGLWQGFVLLAAVALVLRMFPRLSSSIRFAAWGIMFALAIAVPLLHFGTTEHGNGAAAGPVIHVAPVLGLAIALLWAALS